MSSVPSLDPPFIVRTRVKKQNQAFVDHDPGGQGLEHRSRRQGCDDRRANPRRHGLYQGNRRCAALRDIRIATIYEGTTGIRANDLIGRKMAREGDATIKAVIACAHKLDADLAKQPGENFVAIRALYGRHRRAAKAANWIVDKRQGTCAPRPSAPPFLWLFGVVAGGWQMACRYDRPGQDRRWRRRSFYRPKIITTRFFADHQMSRCRPRQHGDERRSRCAGAGRVDVLTQAALP